MAVENPRTSPAGGRMLWLPNTSTDADIQDGLDNTSYDGVSIEGGAAIAITADLTIPAGKVLEGAYYGGDLDDANMAILDLAADIRILVGDGIIRNIAIEQDATSTTSAIVGSGSAVAQYVYVYSSDAAFHDEWAFDTGFQEIDHCRVVGLKGILSEGSDNSGGTIQVSHNYIDCVSLAGSTARGIEFNQSNVKAFNNHVYRGGYGYNITSLAVNCEIYDCVADSCTASGFYGVSMNTVTIHDCHSSSNDYGFNFLTASSSCKVSNLYSATNTTGGISIYNPNYWTIGALYSYNDGGVGVFFNDCDASQVDSVYSYSAGTYGIRIFGGTQSHYGILSSNGSGTKAGVAITDSPSNTKIDSIYSYNSDEEGVIVEGTDMEIGSIFAYDNTFEGVIVSGVDVSIGKITASANTLAGVILGHTATCNRGSIDFIDSSDNQTIGLEFGPSTVTDFYLADVRVWNNTGDGINEIADGDTNEVTIASVDARQNGGYGIDLKTTTNRNWIRNIIAEGNVTAAQITIASGWVSGEPYAKYYFSTPAATTITVGGTLQKASGTTTMPDSEDFTMPANNNAAYTSGTPVNRTRKYNVAFDGDIEANVAELVQIGIRDVAAGSTLLESIVADTLQVTGERQAISCRGTVSLADAGAVEVWVTAATNGTNVTLRGCLSIDAKPSVQ